MPGGRRVWGLHVTLCSKAPLRLRLNVDDEAAAARERRVDFADLCRKAAIAREAPHAGPPLYAPLRS